MRKQQLKNLPAKILNRCIRFIENNLRALPIVCFYKKEHELGIASIEWFCYKCEIVITCQKNILEKVVSHKMLEKVFSNERALYFQIHIITKKAQSPVFKVFHFLKNFRGERSFAITYEFNQILSLVLIKYIIGNNQRFPLSV